MPTMTQVRAWQGAPVFSYGFRPFFLAGSLYAAFLVAVWVPWYLGMIELPSALAPVTWHFHELLFGYLMAIVAGFLLTAVPNWTGRLPVVGTPLIALCLLWLAGRIAVMVSSMLDPMVLVALSLGFPVAFLFVLVREIIAGGNTKNLVVLAAVGALTAAQALT
ncbi:MAG: NnrS family protein, partial [Hyphomicrobiaceae bacterium]